MTPAREAARDRLLAFAGVAGARIEPLAADASFRRYDRVFPPDGPALVLMDAPPEREDVRPFVRVAEILEEWGYSAPGILAADLEAGFLLLQDLGDDLFSRLIAAGGDERPLYAAAVDLLADLARHAPPPDIPAYDMTLLLDEALLLLDWRFPEAVGRPAKAAERDAYLAAWRAVLAPVADCRTTLILRDYHVDNLIWLSRRRGLRRVGLLDFQDSVRGHPAYDLASLLCDIRREMSPALAAEMLDRHIAATGFDEDEFRRAFVLLAAQRNAKILGIFTRLSRRDGKHDYRDLLPRTWRFLRRDLAHEALAPVARWFENYLPHDPVESGDKA